MVQVIITYHYHRCGSTNIVKNDTDKCGNPQYHCKDCGVYQMLEPKGQYTEDEKAIIVEAYKERVSIHVLAYL